jgi:arsenite methyltransferase
MVTADHHCCHSSFYCVAHHKNPRLHKLQSFTTYDVYNHSINSKIPTKTSSASNSSNNMVVETHTLDSKGSTAAVAGEGIKQVVESNYGNIARSGLSNDSQAVRAVAAAFGYSEADLESLPAEANMGLSCGNPVAMASISEGEVVVDLGCGGGLDVFLAAQKVGPTGKVIGIDMSLDMLKRARAGAAKKGVTNVEFHQADIDSLPFLKDESVDCIISNCVVNLVPDKDKVFREMERVLKPGGRIALSDIALKKELPDHARSSLAAYVGCISGAILIDDYKAKVEKAGLKSVVVTDTGADLNMYAKNDIMGNACCDGSKTASCSSGKSQSCCGSSTEKEEKKSSCCGGGSGSSRCCGENNIYCGGGSSTDGGSVSSTAEFLKTFNANEYAASVRVHAVKT